MKKLEAKDLFALQHGDRVHRLDGTTFKRLRYVARMPRCENYLIFCEGEYLTHLYISPKDNSFYCEWYGGEYDNEFLGNILIEKLKKEIEAIEDIYLTDD